MKLVSAELSEAPGGNEFVELVDNVSVFVPVSNVGFDKIVGSGKNNEPIKVPDLSVMSLISDTSAIALLVSPINCIPIETHPKKLESAWFSKLAVSTFKIVVVDE